MHGIIKLRERILGDPTGGWRTSYGATRTVEVDPDEGEQRS
jgi:hypothetical protein